MVKAVSIILAAGHSVRMGRCKTMLPWRDGSTLLTYQIQEFVAVGVQPVVVLGPHNHQRSAPVDLPTAIQWTTNPAPETGKVSSILHGLDHLPSQWDAVFISAVDQPRSADVYRQLLAAFDVHHALITVPSYQHRTGHPALFSRHLWPQLRAISDETHGLRHVVETYRDSTHYVTMDTAEVLLDLNTPAQYEQARREFA
ncbi:MAG: nucleotidyltransferase family protein [Leptolyngbyaceae bacterium]|nr:nucleotidyltransferase family protein [Leptolyngbyaceae bacterium]